MKRKNEITPIPQDAVAATEVGDADTWGSFLNKKTNGPVRQLANPEVDHLLFNRIFGLERADAADEGVLDEMLENYRSLGIGRFFVHLPEDSSSDVWREAMKKRGIVQYRRSWARMVRDNAPPPKANVGLEIVPTPSQNLDATIDLLLYGFDMPQTAKPILARTAQTPGWSHYVALEEGAPIATGWMHREGRVAHLAIAATHPDHRGKGAQKALMIARMKEAIAAGCKWIVTETGAPIANEPNPSLDNMAKMGFMQAGVVENWAPEGTTWS